ncbi:hypothetical protein OHB12_10325 [Nocardia sp. NBC_01730]|uniref:hypothetical protein n=1 Tax=Nocardia sp. NBC_01730 TaxID=2975998 RepID=UPI002E0FF307|nr:hypothetical protein OHB12_10325 [Nocardia sp. NBC_01730]
MGTQIFPLRLTAPKPNMDNPMSPQPEEEDVHLSVQLGDVLFHFTACVTAALLFIQDCRAHRYPKHVTVTSGDTGSYPRLPNERLYLAR